MRRTTIMAYKYEALCAECNKIKEIYYTLSDFGDAPIIKQCKNCGELYLYTLDDESYIQPINKQLAGIRCVKCGSDLLNTLVPTHTNIQCCDSKISLDDDFWRNSVLSEKERVQVEVYLIYS